MTETRHKTVLEVSVKATDVEKTAEGVRDLFDPDRLSDFARGVEQISRSFEFLQRNLETIDRMVTKISAANNGQVAGGRPPPLPAAIAAGGGAFGGGGASGGWGGGDRPGGAGNGGDRPSFGTGAAVGATAGAAVGSAASERIKEERDKEAHRWFKRQNIERWSSAGGKAFSPEGMLSGMAGAVPYAGPAIAGMLQGISQFAGSYTQHRQSIANSFGHTGVASGTELMGAGADFGMGPSEVPGAFGEFAQRSGLRGQRLSGAFRTQLALSRGLGISGAGSYVAAAEAGGGKVENPAKLMMEAVSSGIDAGIHTARIDEFLQNISSWTDEARSKGINVSPDYALALIRQTKAQTSLRGEAAVNFAKSADARLAGYTQSGSPSMGQNLAIQAAQEELGPDASLSDIMLLLENPTPNLHRILNKKLQQYSGGREGVYAVKQLGGFENFAQAKAVVEGDFDAEAQPNTDAEARALLKKESGARSAAFDVSKQEARMQVREVLTGKQVQPVDMQRRQIDMQVAQELAPHAAQGMQAVLDVATGLVKGLETAGIPARFEKMTQDIGDAWEDLNDTYVDIIHSWKSLLLDGKLEPFTAPKKRADDKEPDAGIGGGAGAVGAAMRVLIHSGLIPKEGKKPVTLDPVNIKKPVTLDPVEITGPHSSIGGTMRSIGRLQIELGDKIDQMNFAGEGEVRAG